MRSAVCWASPNALLGLGSSSQRALHCIPLPALLRASLRAPSRRQTPRPLPEDDPGPVAVDVFT